MATRATEFVIPSGATGPVYTSLATEAIHPSNALVVTILTASSVAIAATIATAPTVAPVATAATIATIPTIATVATQVTLFPRLL